MRINRLTALAVFALGVICAAGSGIGLVYGQAGSLVNRVQAPSILDSGGASRVNTSGVNNSYAATSVGLVTAASATDVSCLNGSATRNIHLSRVAVSGTAATAVNVPVRVVYHIALDVGLTGATSTAAPAAYPYWSANPTATATPTAFTANPTTITDATPGILAVGVATFPITSTAGSSSFMDFTFGNRGGVGQPTLTSAAQQLCVHFSSTTVATPVINITWEWTETSGD